MQGAVEEIREGASDDEITMCQYRVMVPGRSVVLRHSMEL